MQKFYICDQKACKDCHPEDCHHTGDISHAVNPDAMDFKQIGDALFETFPDGST